MFFEPSSLLPRRISKVLLWNQSLETGGQDTPLFNDNKIRWVKQYRRDLLIMISMWHSGLFLSFCRSLFDKQYIFVSLLVVLIVDWRVACLTSGPSVPYYINFTISLFFRTVGCYDIGFFDTKSLLPLYFCRDVFFSDPHKQRSFRRSILYDFLYCRPSLALYPWIYLYPWIWFIRLPQFILSNFVFKCFIFCFFIFFCYFCFQETFLFV